MYNLKFFGACVLTGSLILKLALQNTNNKNADEILYLSNLFI